LPPVREVNPAVPEPVAAVIEKMLAREPNERYQNATVLVAALRGIEEPSKLETSSTIELKPRVTT
jgi:hypothetical protein